MFNLDDHVETYFPTFRQRLEKTIRTNQNSLFNSLPKQRFVKFIWDFTTNKSGTHAGLSNIFEKLYFLSTNNTVQKIETENAIVFPNKTGLEPHRSICILLKAKRIHTVLSFLVAGTPFLGINWPISVNCFWLLFKITAFS